MFIFTILKKIGKLSVVGNAKSKNLKFRVGYLVKISSTVPKLGNYNSTTKCFNKSLKNVLMLCKIWYVVGSSFAYINKFISLYIVPSKQSFNEVITVLLLKMLLITFI